MNKVRLNLISENEVIGVNDAPAVSIIMPFEPKMSAKAEIEYRLKLAVAKIEKELMLNYPSEKALPVIHRLSQLIHHLNFNTHKKSIAVFVSPIIEKVFYLDVAVTEKIIIDESFEIRDLVYSKKCTTQYLVFVLSGKSSKMYLGNCSQFILIKNNVPDNVFAYKRDLPEKVTHFSDAHAEKEIELDKFLRHMDDGLSLILKAYPLPVLLMGAKRVLGHFKEISKNQNHIVEYIHGNYEEATETEIRELIKPYISDWNKIRQQNLMQQIEQSMNENKLSFGTEDVWTAASNKNGRLLIVEKDFMFPAHYGTNANRIYAEDSSMQHPFYIKDAVDDVMEKILQNGGDVEFVENGVLKNYGKIALIRYY